MKIRKRSRRGLPLREYEVGGTVLRLNEDDARARGLLPPVEEPAVVATADPTVDVPPVDGRVGEVLSWAGESDEGRIRAALDAERAARARPTLVTELERRLVEV